MRNNICFIGINSNLLDSKWLQIIYLYWNHVETQSISLFIISTLQIMSQRSSVMASVPWKWNKISFKNSISLISAVIRTSSQNIPYPRENLRGALGFIPQNLPASDMMVQSTHTCPIPCDQYESIAWHHSIQIIHGNSSRRLTLWFASDLRHVYTTKFRYNGDKNLICPTTKYVKQTLQAQSRQLWRILSRWRDSFLPLDPDGWRRDLPSISFRCRCSGKTPEVCRAI